MANRIASGIKRNRQNIKRRLRNKMAKSEIRTYLKKIMKAVELKKNAEAIELSKIYISKLDKAVKRHILHKNTANRNKSRVSKIINRIKSDVSVPEVEGEKS